MNLNTARKGLLILFVLGARLAGAQSDTISRMKLVFAGDIMGHGPQITAATVEKDKVFDYTPCFQFVEPILKDADLAIGNLELTLPGKPPYTGYPTFRSPDDLALALRAAGFNLLVTSNNHSNDSGLNGVTKTIKTLQNYGFYQTGTFLDSLHRAALYPLLVYKDHFKLAFLNYTYGTNGLPTPAPAVVNLIDENAIREDLRVAKELNPDFIIVLFHWGNEYQINESESQRKLAQKAFEWGADLVIGAHPHVVQPIKTIKYKRPGQDSLTGVVAYSLGNFISAQKQAYTDLGLMVEVTLEKHLPSNATRLADHAYLPIFRYIHRDAQGKSQYYTLPVSAFEAEKALLPLPIPAATLLHMRTTADAIRKHLNKFGGKERRVGSEVFPSKPDPAPEPASNN